MDTLTKLMSAGATYGLSVRELNLFRQSVHRSALPEVVRVQRTKTWVYVLLLPALAMSVLVMFAIAPQLKQVTLLNPSLDDYLALQQHSPVCPCGNVVLGQDYAYVRWHPAVNMSTNVCKRVNAMYSYQIGSSNVATSLIREAAGICMKGGIVYNKVERAVAGFSVLGSQLVPEETLKNLIAAAALEQIMEGAQVCDLYPVSRGDQSDLDAGRPHASWHPPAPVPGKIQCLCPGQQTQDPDLDDRGCNVNLYFQEGLNSTNITNFMCRDGLRIPLLHLGQNDFPHRWFAPFDPWPGNDNSSDVYHNFTWWRTLNFTAINVTSDLFPGLMPEELNPFNVSVPIGMPNDSATIDSLSFNHSTLYPTPAVYWWQGVDSYINSIWGLSVANLTFYNTDPTGSLPINDIVLPKFNMSSPFTLWQDGVLNVDYKAYEKACKPTSCTYSYNGTPTLIQLLTSVLGKCCESQHAEIAPQISTAGIIGGMSTLLYWTMRCIPTDFVLLCSCWYWGDRCCGRAKVRHSHDTATSGPSRKALTVPSSSAGGGLAASNVAVMDSAATFEAESPSRLSEAMDPARFVDSTRNSSASIQLRSAAYLTQRIEAGGDLPETIGYFSPLEQPVTVIGSALSQQTLAAFSNRLAPTPVRQRAAAARPPAIGGRLQPVPIAQPAVLSMVSVSNPLVPFIGDHALNLNGSSIEPSATTQPALTRSILGRNPPQQPATSGSPVAQASATASGHSLNVYSIT